MFPERRAVLKLFFSAVKVRRFFRHVQICVISVEYQAVTQDVFAVSGCKIVRTIQKTKFESLKLKPFDKKVLFLLIFVH
jgi:hypothetical protein